MAVTRLVVYARAVSGSDFSKFRILVDGEAVDDGRATSAMLTGFSFDLEGLDDGAGHSIGIQHYHDTSGRVLTIDRIEVNDTAIAASDGVQDIGPLDGNNLKNGDAAGTIAFNGTLLFDLAADVLAGSGEPPPPSPPSPPPPPPPPTDEETGDATEIIVTAHKQSGSDFAKAELVIDGQSIGQVRFTASTPTEVRFAVEGLDDGSDHIIEIRHYHDTSARALHVDGLTVNGAEIDLNGGYQDIGARDDANIIHGSAASTIQYNGALVLDVASTAFESGQAPTPPPEPPADPPLQPDDSFVGTVESLGPVAFWQFDEAGGTTALDGAGAASGTYRLGAAPGAAGLASSGGAAVFDGTNDHITVTFGGDWFDLMVLGDSLTVSSSARITVADSFPTRLDHALAADGYDVNVIAYSKSGDTTAKGLTRLVDYFADGSNPEPDAAIIALGTNDSRQERPIDDVRQDLTEILEIFDARDIDMLLSGSYGTWPLHDDGYQAQVTIDAFEAIFADLADDYGTLFDPFLLAGILDDADTLTSDDLHPNAEGTQLMVDRLLPQIEQLVDQAGYSASDNPLDIAEGSVVMWIEADDTSGRQGLLSKDASGYGSGGHVSLYLDGDKVELRLQDADSSHKLTSASGAVQAGEATQIAFTFGSDGARLYVDDLLVDSDPYSGGLDGNNEALIIGALGWTSSPGTTSKVTNHFDGVIDEVAIFDSVLSGTQIAALHDLVAQSDVQSV